MSIKKCIECGQPFDASLSDCPCCGCPADATMLCPECATSYDAALQSCPECGCPNDSLVATQVEAPQVQFAHEDMQPAHEEVQLAHEEVQLAHEEVQSAHEEVQPAHEEVTSAGIIYFATDDSEPAETNISQQPAVPAPEPVELSPESVELSPESVELSPEPVEASQDVIRCRECGEVIPHKAKICPNCGCPVEEGKVCCLECGVFYDEKLVECPECGCPNETLDLGVKEALLQQEKQELAELAEEKRKIANFLQYSMNYENESTSSVVSTVFSAFIRCANFKGRSRRSEFWCYLLFNCLIGFGLYLALFANFGKDYMKISTLEGSAYYQALLESCLRDHLFIMLVILVYGLLLILPSISLTARRLHDTNRSSLWMLMAPLTFFASMWITSIPTYLGLGILTIMLLLDSVPDNKYGRCHVKD